MRSRADTKPRGTLAERCSWCFNSQARERAVSLWRGGHVQLVLPLQPAPNVFTIHARVRESAGALHAVLVVWLEDMHEFGASCSCPLGVSDVLCKHVYATLLSADHLVAKENDLPDDATLGVFADPNPMEYVRAEDDEEEIDYGLPSPMVRAPRQPPWREVLDGVEHSGPPLRRASKKKKRLEYHVELSSGVLAVRLVWRNILQSGELGRGREANLVPAELDELPAADREILALANGCAGTARFGYYYGATYLEGHLRTSSGFEVADLLTDPLLTKLSNTGRFGIRARTPGVAVGDLEPLTWDPAPYRLILVLGAGSREGGLTVCGMLDRGSDRLEVAALAGVSRAGVAHHGTRLIRIDPSSDESHKAWLRELFAKGGELVVSAREADAFVQALAHSAHVPPIETQADCPWSVEVAKPTAHVRFLEAESGHKKIAAQLWFAYPHNNAVGTLVRWGERGIGLVQETAKRLLVRDGEAELALVAELGLEKASAAIQRRYTEIGGADFAVVVAEFIPTVRRLLAAEWHVEAEGKRLRSSKLPQIRVRSGVDWFELSIGGMPHDEAALALPELLRALRKREAFVRLGDGSQALLPESWLDRYGMLAQLGNTTGEGTLKVSRNTGVLLDTLLGSLPDVDIDAGFARFRKEIARFQALRPAKPPASFTGTLRSYQAEGLGWLKMLGRFGLGGCLADDMGLGKTVQVLALIAGIAKRKGAPVLVVAPKSLVFNWLDEARRFVPRLRATSYVGSERKQLLPALDEHELIVTSYGTLRRDILELARHRFRLVVLDEASAIKNPTSQTAKACRLLDTEQRLALTGTPIENRLTDLASILEFLNPGMVRSTSSLEAFLDTRAGAADAVVLGRALRPVLLRRTKQQVLTELPPKTEQILRCELGRKQRALYDELRDHYRALLDKSIGDRGLKRSKIQVLEALLRLRQAACHPGLIDPERRSDPAAKLEALMAPLMDVAQSGHKALVFSQFTSFLALVRDQLEAAGLNYAYLDGKTSKRKEVVERFQNDADCPVFLISLKAGGHGLNLTAAEYVFLLDPWWNPAVEAQAVDRAHRIGQSSAVFSYRMIATDTVEDRVLELQDSKRKLAEGLFAGNHSVLRELTASDLERLLS